MASPVATLNVPARALPLTTSSQVSRSASRLERGARRQFDPFEREVRVGYQKRPFIREPLRFEVNVGRPRVCHGDGVLQRAAHACGRNRTCGTLRRSAAGSPQSRDPRRSRGSYRRERRQHHPPTPSATRQDPRSSRRRQPRAIAAERSRFFRPRAILAPGAALRMYQASVLPRCQAHRLRVRIVWMNLNGKWLAREQQLEQERRI